MNSNNGFGKNTLIGGALLLASLAIAAIGVIVSLRTGSERYFLIASIPTAALIVAGGMKIRQGMLMGENRLLLPAGEQTITAEVLGVTRSLRTAGEKTTYCIVARYKDPVTGREETYSSRPLDSYPGKEVIGKTVTVRLDPTEKGKYVVEIDPLLEAVKKERGPQAGIAQPDASEPEAPKEGAAPVVEPQENAALAAVPQESAAPAAEPQESAALAAVPQENAEESSTGGENGGTA